MKYWVVRLDGSSSNMQPDHYHYREVKLWGPYDSWEKAKQAADRSNEAEARSEYAKLRNPRPVEPGTTLISFDVVSDDDLQDYYRVGTRVVR